MSKKGGQGWGRIKAEDETGRGRQGKGIRCPITRLPARRASSPALADGIGALEGRASVIGEAGNDGRVRAGVGVDVGRGPAGEGNAGVEGVELGGSGWLVFCGLGKGAQWRVEWEGWTW